MDRARFAPFRRNDANFSSLDPIDPPLKVADASLGSDLHSVLLAGEHARRGHSLARDSISKAAPCPCIFIFSRETKESDSGE